MTFGLNLGFLLYRSWHNRGDQPMVRQASQPREWIFEQSLASWIDEAPGEDRAIAAKQIKDALNKKSTVLNLSGLKLSNLPPIIGRLRHLTALILSNNRLTTLPKEIKQLRNLEQLSLMNNQLESLPEEIGNLLNLQKLVLSYNRLRVLSAAIGNMVSLVELSLSNNYLESLPETIGNLQRLERLKLSYNQLSVLLPAISGLRRLERLDLESNAFVGITDQIRLLLLRLVTVSHDFQNSAELLPVIEVPNMIKQESPQDWGAVLQSITHEEKIGLLTSQDYSGDTVLHHAIMYNDFKSIDSIFLSLTPQEISYIVNIKNKEGQTALHLALLKKRGYDILELLIKNGTDVDAQDVNGDTVLHLAEKRRVFPLTRLLIENGASLDIRNHQNQLAVDSKERNLQRAQKVYDRWTQFRVVTDETNRVLSCSLINSQQKKSVLALLAKYTHNTAFKIYANYICSEIDDLITLSDHFYSTCLETVGSVEEVTRLLRGRKSDFLILKGHGPGESRFLGSVVQLGEGKNIKGRESPLLLPGNATWLKVIKGHIKKNGTLVFDSCGLAREEREHKAKNLCQEAADYLASKGVTVIGSDKSMKSHQVLYQLESFPPVRFFCNSEEKECVTEVESTVCYQDGSKVKYSYYQGTIVMPNYWQ